MEREERDLIARPKPSEQSRKVKKPLPKSRKNKESSAAALPPPWLNSTQPRLLQSNQAPEPCPDFFHKRSPHTYSNIVRINVHNQSDSSLPIPEKEKEIPSEKNLDMMIQFKGSSEFVGHYSDRSGRSEKEGTSYRNYAHCLSTSIAANGDEASGESHETNQDLSALKKQRLNQTNANDYSMVKDSVADRLGTALNLGMMYSVGAVPTTTIIKISNNSELRKQRRQMNRESAKMSRFHKQQECENLQERIEALKADNSGLTEELRSLSEECSRIVEKNKRIKEKLVQKYGQDVIDDLKDSWPELGDHERER